MQYSETPPDRPPCPVCRAEVPPGSPLCGVCGSKVAQTPAQEILSLNYLLAELVRWEAEGVVKPEQSRTLREAYERKREELRARLRGNGGPEKQRATQQETNVPPAPEGAKRRETPPPQTGSQE